MAFFQLAANMGTSVEMIEDFYGKKRMQDPKIATGKFRRRTSGSGANNNSADMLRSKENAQGCPMENLNP